MQVSQLFVFLILMGAFLAFALWRNKLTPAACVTAAAVGCCIFAGIGLPGIYIIGAFFLLAVTATRWGTSVKQRLDFAEHDGGRRNSGQVLANGGVAALLGIFAWAGFVDRDLCFLLLAGALSSATADTLSSELGTLYGQRYVDIINFKLGKKGENGVVSMEGTLIGVAASAIIAVLTWMETNAPMAILVVVIAGTFGNLVDSILGATLERKGHLSNNAVNFLNTFAAAALTWLLIKLFY